MADEYKPQEKMWNLHGRMVSKLGLFLEIAFMTEKKDWKKIKVSAFE